MLVAAGSSFAKQNRIFSRRRSEKIFQCKLGRKGAFYKYMKTVHFASPYSRWLNAMVLALAATICLLSVAEGRAEPAARKPATTKTKSATAIRPAARTERMEITGSRIRQRVRRVGKSVD